MTRRKKGGHTTSTFQSVVIKSVPKNNPLDEKQIEQFLKDEPEEDILERKINRKIKESPTLLQGIKDNRNSIIFVIRKKQYYKNMNKILDTKQAIIIKDDQYINMNGKIYINLKNIFTKTFGKFTLTRKKYEYFKKGYLDITNILERGEDLTNIPIYLLTRQKGNGLHSYIEYYGFEKPHEKARPFYVFVNIFVNFVVNKDSSKVNDIDAIVDEFIVTNSDFSVTNSRKSIKKTENKTKHKPIKNKTI